MRGGRTITCSVFREVLAHTKGLLEELNDVKVIPEYSCCDLAKVFDEDVKKGADKHKGIKWANYVI